LLTSHKAAGAVPRFGKVIRVWTIGDITVGSVKVGSLLRTIAMILFSLPLNAVSVRSKRFPTETDSISIAKPVQRIPRCGSKLERKKTMKEVLFASMALCAPMMIVTALCGVVALCEAIGERLGKKRFQRWERDRQA
jgi:hypothetical protein